LLDGFDGVPRNYDERQSMNFGRTVSLSPEDVKRAVLEYVLRADKVKAHGREPLPAELRQLEASAEVHLLDEKNEPVAVASVQVTWSE
jgi:hypothetical protein